MLFVDLDGNINAAVYPALGALVRRQLKESGELAALNLLAATITDCLAEETCSGEEESDAPAYE